MAFLVWPMTDDPAITDEEWTAQQRLKWKNPNCGHWGQSSDLSPILRGTGSVRTDLNFTEAPHRRLISRRLANLLMLEQDLLLTTAPVYMKDGTESIWLSYRLPCEVQIRGGKDSYCFRCKFCRQVCYTPMNGWYLLKSQIPQCDVFGLTGYTGLGVRHSVAQRLKELRLKNVTIKPIKILDQPVDGFPENLSEIAPDKERRVKGTVG